MSSPKQPGLCSHMSLSLSRRLQVLADTYKQTLALIQELHNFPVAQVSVAGDADERRVELGNEIHDRLKEQEDSLELLRQEVEDDSTATPTRAWASSSSNRRSDRDTERERNADLIARLSEDLKSARTRFRRAQLHAKRASDDAKRKEREALFRRDVNVESTAQPRRPGQEKLTQEEIARNASEDVTRALRRTHDLLQGNLSQSQFAQQTLDESQNALKGLAENYGGTGDLLKNSRSLVGQLVRSNKSDTWYLQSAFYLLAVTIAWLVFRRLLYGPLWWLVWMPLKLMWWTTLTSLGAMGLGQTSAEVASSVSTALPSGVNAKGFPTNAEGVQFKSMGLPAKGGGWDPPPPAEANTMVEQIGRMVNEAVVTMTEEKRQQEEEQPRNPKKRIMELEKEEVTVKNEL